METSRFFVANLPADTKEKDLRNIFQDYGEIKNIELKTKGNLVDPSDVKVLAFVTLYLGADDAKYCLNDLNWHKINGEQIKVSLAKESFLERLKREREEANAISDGSQQPVAPPEEEQSELLTAPKQNKRKTFDVNAELGDDDVAIELMITKKRAATSLFNGRIVIQSQEDVKPIHVIEKKKKRKNELDNQSSNVSDQKRKESMNKMKNQYQQQKSAIQLALQDANARSKNKIKFSDAESEAEEETEQAPNNAKTTNIFGSDDEDDDDANENLQIKALPSGKKGEKLLQLQAKQSLDPRFRIDAKFVDDDEDEEDNSNAAGTINKDNNEESERQWQMNILEQVVGTKLDTVKKADKSHNNKKMLRYDPSKDEHQKFERTKEELAKTKKSKQKENTTKEKSETGATDTPAEVSKEVFYVVKDTLQESLRTRGEGFSLLNMFGQNDALDQRDEQLKELGKEKILVNNKLEKAFNVNPFNYDSSSESEQEEQEEQENIVSNANAKPATQKKSKNKTKIASESFFIVKTDKRLKEGAQFFIYKKADDAKTENYEEVRNRLKLMIKTKIIKTKKNLANAGYKGKRKV